MGLNALTTRVFGAGKVTIDSSGITVEGFDSVNASCRDVAVLACAWAIGELQREMVKSIEQPGGGNIGIG